MIIPIRCMSCGKPLGHLWEEFTEKIRSKAKKDVLDELGLKRYCCRAQMISHVDLIGTAARFKRF